MFMQCKKYKEYKAYFNNKSLQIIVATILGIFIGIVGIYILSEFNFINLNSKKYVYVNIEKVIESVNQELAKQIENKKISETEFEDKLILAKTRFDMFKDEYTKKNNAVIFSSTKVIAGASNITELFIVKILAGIKQ